MEYTVGQVNLKILGNRTFYVGYRSDQKLEGVFNGLQTKVYSSWWPPFPKYWSSGSLISDNRWSQLACSVFQERYCVHSVYWGYYSSCSERETDRQTQLSDEIQGKKWFGTFWTPAEPSFSIWRIVCIKVLFLQKSVKLAKIILFELLTVLRNDVNFMRCN